MSFACSGYRLAGQRAATPVGAPFSTAACTEKGIEAVGKYGAGYKVRTRDPLITNQVLYQLS